MKIKTSKSALSAIRFIAMVYPSYFDFLNSIKDVDKEIYAIEESYTLGVDEMQLFETAIDTARYLEKKGMSGKVEMTRCLADSYKEDYKELLVWSSNEINKDTLIAAITDDENYLVALMFINKDEKYAVLIPKKLDLGFPEDSDEEDENNNSLTDEEVGDCF